MNYLKNFRAMNESLTSAERIRALCDEAMKRPDLTVTEKLFESPGRQNPPAAGGVAADARPGAVPPGGNRGAAPTVAADAESAGDERPAGRTPAPGGWKRRIFGRRGRA
jgi:hypothetical protein